ncbi:hypothetical protein [Actinophytocola sp.]|uniref:hypothetical protein n=1 Tax=Actinophytocola sp. TaxID=1872138 RepID=UPI002D7E5147|nr:hypothetical protein [Actinophytocola sp.]HET9144070.1 hypothetical protein [Actinophytocola sp.]
MTTDKGNFRYIGTTSDVVECENCGKADLRCTVIIMPVDAEGNDDGEPCYYGSTCAARALGVRGGGAAVRSAATGARLQTLMNAHDAVRMLKLYGLPLSGEMTDDQRKTAVRAYVRYNSGVQARIAEHGGTVSDMVRDMLARKHAAIAEAVLVAGAGWKDDKQPLDWGYRPEITRCWAQVTWDDVKVD